MAPVSMFGDIFAHRVQSGLTILLSLSVSFSSEPFVTISPEKPGESGLPTSTLPSTNPSPPLHTSLTSLASHWVV